MSGQKKKSIGKQWTIQDQKLYVEYKNRIDAGEKLPEIEYKEYHDLFGRFIKHRIDTDSDFRSAYEILAKGFQSVSDLKAQGVKLSADEEEQITTSFIKIAISKGAFNLGNICKNEIFS